MRKLIEFGVLLVVVGCAAQPVTVSRQVASEPGLPRVFDAHIHLEFEGPDPFREFRENNVVAAVAHASRKDPLPKNINAPFRLVQCLAALPTGPLNEAEKALKEKRAGCIKVYLGYIHKWASDPGFVRYYKLAQKYDVPVVFHTGDPFDKKAKVKYADPLTIDEIAVDFPKVRFLIAHAGNPWFASAAEVVYKNDNVFVDTSALLIGDMNEKDPEALEELVVKPLRWFFLYVENHKKVLFGTDWPLVKTDQYIRLIQKAIPPKYWKDVFYQNAADFFLKGENLNLVRN